MEADSLQVIAECYPQVPAPRLHGLVEFDNSCYLFICAALIQIAANLYCMPSPRSSAETDLGRWLDKFQGVVIFVEVYHCLFSVSA